jgi:RTX calcium-binding nonapeptide repeat (4 copies)
LIIIISIIFPLQYSVIKFANGQIPTIESRIIVYDDNSSENHSLLDDSDSILHKPKVDVSIEGTQKKDKIKGGEGDDYLFGDNGSDQLRGEEGKDEIDGGKGNDILHGEDGDDKIRGHVGNDRISGGLGDDQIEGDKGDDRLFGGDGDDLLDGGEGNDALLGGRGFDIMIGGFGHDTFVCDQFDKLIDFNQYEGDEIIGSCLDEYLVEGEEEKEIEETPAFNDNIFPLEVEEFDSFSSPKYSSPPLPPMNTFDKPPLSDEDLQRIPPPPMPSLNF